MRAEDLTLDDELRPTFVLASPWERAKVTLRVRGRHQVENALAAAAAGLAEGIGEAAVVRGLERGSLSRWRMELATAPSGAVILNDAYNANPTSVAAALESLAALPARRRIAVLGVMAELGRSLGGRPRARSARGPASSASASSRWPRPTYGGEDVAIDRRGARRARRPRRRRRRPRQGQPRRRPRAPGRRPPRALTPASVGVGGGALGDLGGCLEVGVGGQARGRRRRRRGSPR